MDIRGPVSYRLLDEKVYGADNGRLSDCLSGDARLRYPLSPEASRDLTELFFNLPAYPVGEVNHFLDILKGTEHRLYPFSGQGCQLLNSLDVPRVFHGYH